MEKLLLFHRDESLSWMLFALIWFSCVLVFSSCLQNFPQVGTGGEENF